MDSEVMVKLLQDALKQYEDLSRAYALGVCFGLRLAIEKIEAQL